jgi:hypothetical protein
MLSFGPEWVKTRAAAKSLMKRRAEMTQTVEDQFSFFHPLPGQLLFPAAEQFPACRLKEQVGGQLQDFGKEPPSRAGLNTG